MEIVELARQADQAAHEGWPEREAEIRQELNGLYSELASVAERLTEEVSAADWHHLDRGHNQAGREECDVVRVGGEGGVLALLARPAAVGFDAALRTGFYPFLLGARPKDKEQAIERTVKLFDVVGSPGFDRDESDLRALAAESFDRGQGDDAGTGRQLQAVLASGNRTKALKTITAPTLVIHGKADKLVNPTGGRATARAIPGARLVSFTGMGHDLPRQLWPHFVDLIAEHAAKAPATQRERAAA